MAGMEGEIVVRKEKIVVPDEFSVPTRTGAMRAGVVEDDENTCSRYSSAV